MLEIYNPGGLLVVVVVVGFEGGRFPIPTRSSRFHPSSRRCVSSRLLFVSQRLVLTQTEETSAFAGEKATERLDQRPRRNTDTDNA